MQNDKPKQIYQNLLKNPEKESNIIDVKSNTNQIQGGLKNEENDY